MIEDFKPALAKTLVYEGGWADNPKDPGGATMRGITLTTFRRYVPGASKADLRNISMTMVEHIYKVGFWDLVGGDKLPSGVSAVVFDYAVHSGTARAIKTLNAAQLAHPNDPRAQVIYICESRLAFLKGLATFKTFGKNWAWRAKDDEAFGLTQVSLKVTPAPAPPVASPSIITPIASATPPSTSAPLASALWGTLVNIFSRKQA